jgi:ferredoxin--NADP+ reductase
VGDKQNRSRSEGAKQRSATGAQARAAWSAQNTRQSLRVAVVGSGPSGFYAAEALLKSGREVRVDMIERLPAPYGLVRYGVAPDHPKLKEPILVYSAIARLPHFSLLGNVTVGRDVSVDELRAHYHAVVFTCGAQTDRRLGIPGEDLPGSHTATEFVAWYNGHPDYRDHRFDLAQGVAIVGQGNVAADLAGSSPNRWTSWDHRHRPARWTPWPQAG